MSEFQQGIYRKLQLHTASYVDTLNKYIQSSSLQETHHLAKRIDWTFTYFCSDGVASFYLSTPKKQFSDGKDHYMVFDYRKYTLNEICQSLSFSTLKLYSYQEGELYSTEPPPNTVVLPPEGGNRWMIHENVAEGSSISSLNLTGIILGPTINVINGIQNDLPPQRMHIWCPVIDYPHIGLNRMFQWVCAEFWWHPEKLNIVPTKANEVAKAEIEALRIIENSLSNITQEVVKRDTKQAAHEILEGYCEEFTLLLDEFPEQEEKIHQWLYDSKHQIFLATNYEEVRSKVPFGSRISDFVIKNSDGTYILVEIESAGTPIFTKSAEPTAQFNHACNQVRDWQRYIRENMLTVRNELRLENIYEPNGMVVLGRNSQIKGQDAENRWKDIKNKHEHDVYTYDDLIERVRSLARNLKIVYD